MDLWTWALILFATGIVMLVAEMFLPTHGLLGVGGASAIVGAIACCFAINQYLGVAALVLTAVASPFVFGAAMKLWPKTPLGRRMVLQPTESRLQPPLVRLGEEGVALSELRPMGTCQFGDQRVEVRSDLGLIPPGTKVKVVNIDAGRLIVRAVEA